MGNLRQSMTDEEWDALGKNLNDPRLEAALGSQTQQTNIIDKPQGVGLDAIKKDMVNSPPHYGEGPMQVINIIEYYELNFRLANVIKYVLRAGKKNNTVEDLEKGVWYLKREIENLKNKES